MTDEETTKRCEEQLAILTEMGTLAAGHHVRATLAAYLVMLTKQESFGVMMLEGEQLKHFIGGINGIQ